MSYISILLPAFHLKTLELNEIKNYCSNQFNVSLENFELLNFDDGTNNINYAIKFFESSLSLSSIEDLIYQRSCTQSLTQKIFESLQSLSSKLNYYQNQFTSESNNNILKANLNKESKNIAEKLNNEIESNINLRLSTEKTLNKIKSEFHSMIKELNILRKKTEWKCSSQRETKTTSVNKINLKNNRYFINDPNEEYITHNRKSTRELDILDISDDNGETEIKLKEKNHNCINEKFCFSNLTTIESNTNFSNNNWTDSINKISVNNSSNISISQNNEILNLNESKK